MFKWLSKLGRTTAEPGRYFGKQDRGGNEEKIALRRWEAAQLTRLNESQWSSVTGRTLNQDLTSYLEIIRARCEFEASINSFVEGVINTHKVDIVGSKGPILQVQSDSKGFNKSVEHAWEDWWENPDINGVLSGVEMLDLWVRSWWTSGEYLAQLVTKRDKRGQPEETKLLNIAPRRLQTPFNRPADKRLILGVLRNKNGKPIAYFIQKDIDALGTADLRFDRIAARDMIHVFVTLEAGQVRGVPFLATSLQSIKDTHDFDNETMDAARGAADFGVVLQTDHPDADFEPVSEITDFERRTIRTMPPGWKATHIQPTHPGPQYVPYREERHREIGRAVGMPLNMIRLDSRKHNFSSARFDGQNYQRAVAKLQALIARTTLNRLVAILLTEGRIGQTIKNPPDRFKLRWNWPRLPHVDPLKETKASTERLNNHTSTLREEAAAHGLDWEEVIEQQGREREAKKAKGLIVESQPNPVKPAGSNANGNGKAQKTAPARFTA